MSLIFYESLFIPTFAAIFKNRFSDLKMRSVILSKYFHTLTFLLFFVGLSNVSFAFEPNEEPNKDTATAQVSESHEGENAHASNKFDAGKMIVEHIGDSHQWHLWGDHGHAIHIPLPVILKTDKGWEFFLSSKVEHHDDVYKGTHYSYKLHNEHIEIVNPDTGEVNKEASEKIIDLSITKNVFSLLFSAFLMLFVFISVAKSYNKRKGMAPKGLQSFMEPLILFVRDDVAKTSIGPKYEKFMPYLLTVFFFILINNLMGLIPIFPGGSNLTGNIAICAVLAAITLVFIILNSNAHFWKHIFAMPGVPIPVLIILTPIEILGFFLRPFVLMIRLFANITAGHIIALAFFSLIFIFGEISTGAGYGVAVVSVAFTIFMGLMELLVAFLQAYVFTLLSAIYFGSAVEEAHHDDHH